MRNLFYYIICLISVLGSISAQPKDSIVTIYENGEFKTHFESRIKAPTKIITQVADQLESDFHNTPGNLFMWALKDLGLQNKNNEVIIVFKSSSNDVNNVTHGKFDIIVPYFTSFNNVSVDAIVTKSNVNNTFTVNANIIYSSLLLKNALGSISFSPLKNNEKLVSCNVKIKFGWFFNLFITKKRYKSIVEWRIKKFVENIKLECSKRVDAEKNNSFLTP